MITVNRKRSDRGNLPLRLVLTLRRAFSRPLWSWCTSSLLGGVDGVEGSARRGGAKTAPRRGLVCRPLMRRVMDGSGPPWGGAPSILGEAAIPVTYKSVLVISRCRSPRTLCPAGLSWSSQSFLKPKQLLMSWEHLRWKGQYGPLGWLTQSSLLQESFHLTLTLGAVDLLRLHLFALLFVLGVGDGACPSRVRECPFPALAYSSATSSSGAPEAKTRITSDPS